MPALAVEFGYGHGLWLGTVLNSLPGWRGLGYDISPACLELAGLMMDSLGIEKERAQLSLADVMGDGAPRPQACEAIIANGLLEHLERPDLFLKSLAPCLRPGAGLMFIMAPTNISHPDHLILFKTVDDIKKLFGPAGLSVVEDLTIDVPRTADEKVYLAILARSL